MRDGYPDEEGYVNDRQKEIMDMWKALQDKGKDRKQKLEDAAEKQKFKDERKDLVSGSTFSFPVLMFRSLCLALVAGTRQGLLYLCF